MKVSKEVRESLEKIPHLMFALATQAVVFAENMTEAAKVLTEEIQKIEVEEDHDGI